MENTSLRFQIAGTHRNALYFDIYLSDTKDDYVERQLRREAVSQWLADSSKSRVEEEMESAPLTVSKKFGFNF